METWTTTRWELEHRSVQGGIEPLRLKSHQALNFKMKCDFLSCFLPDFGIVINNWDLRKSYPKVAAPLERRHKVYISLISVPASFYLSLSPSTDFIPLVMKSLFPLSLGP